MAHGPESPSASSACRLDAYRLAVEFDRAAARLEVKGDLRDQLSRPSASTAPHFYSMALGSARECAAVLELVAGRTGRVDREASRMLNRVIRTIEGLVSGERNTENGERNTDNGRGSPPSANGYGRGRRSIPQQSGCAGRG